MGNYSYNHLFNMWIIHSFTDNWIILGQRSMEDIPHYFPRCFLSWGFDYSLLLALALWTWWFLDQQHIVSCSTTCYSSNRILIIIYTIFDETLHFHTFYRGCLWNSESCDNQNWQATLFRSKLELTSIYNNGLWANICFTVDSLLHGKIIQV